MTSDTFHQDITRATGKLLELARTLTFNQISDDCLFIYSEITGSETLKSMYVGKAGREPKTLEEVLPELLNIYSTLYDINLYIYKSTATLTVIDIRYYLTPDDFIITATDKIPMLHAKVPLPLYATVNEAKFDINWHLNPPGHRWKMCRYRVLTLAKIRLGIRL